MDVFERAMVELDLLMPGPTLFAKPPIFRELTDDIEADGW